MATGGVIPEARGALGRVEDRRRALARLPPAPWPTVDEFRGRLERLMVEFEGATLRQRKAFQRELEDLATAFDRRSHEGRWSPKYVKVFLIAFRDARRLHFPNARKILRKLDKPLEVHAQWRTAVEEYRRLYRQAQQDLEALRAQRDGLKAIPRPPLAPNEATAVEDQLSAYNAAATELLRAMVTRWHPWETLAVLLGGSSRPELRLPAPRDGVAAEALVAFLRERPGLTNVLPTAGVAGLLELSQYSNAKLAHLAPGAMDLRRHVLENQAWLRAILETQGRGLTLAWEDATPGRIRGLREFLASVPDPGETLSRLEALEDRAASGALAQAREAQALYARHGDVARRRFEGNLGKDIGEVEARISALQASLDELPKPEDVGRSP